MCRASWCTLDGNPDRWIQIGDRSKKKKKENVRSIVRTRANRTKPRGLLGIVGVGYGIRNIEERLSRADLTDAI